MAPCHSGVSLVLEQHENGEANESGRVSMVDTRGADCLLRGGESPFETVSYKKWKRRPTVMGSNKNADASGFGGADARIWLYVGRAKSGTSSDHVLAYLKSHMGTDDVTCEGLNGKGQYPSFKVGAPASFKDRLDDSSFWPAGIVVRRFNFRSSFQTRQSNPPTT